MIPESFQSIESLQQDLRARRKTSVDLVIDALSRIEAIDQSRGIRAITCVNSAAIDQARDADNRRYHGEVRSPLDGIPITVKDCIETKDMPTTYGSEVFDRWCSGRDAEVVRRLHKAGAVVIAKTNLDDFAAATTGRSSLWGTMNHPNAPGRTVGGSSGGAAASVSAGYVPLALGTDTGGSLRIPAAACGVTTFRPGNNALPLEGIFPRSLGQDRVGFIGRSVDDVLCAHRTVADVGQSGLGDRGQGASALRLAVVPHGLVLSGEDSSGPVAELFSRLTDELYKEGFRVVNGVAPPPDLLAEASLITPESSVAVDAYLRHLPGSPIESFEELWRSQGYSLAAKVSFDREYEVACRPQLQAQIRQRALVARERLKSWTKMQIRSWNVDAVLYPTTQSVTGPAGIEQDGIYTRWAEHADLPAVSLPMGRIQHGTFPLSANVELITAPGHEMRALMLARYVESVINQSALLRAYVGNE